jgi:NADH-quinone oxidoreductase subunit N
MYFDEPETEEPLHVSTDLQIVMSLNGLAVLGLGVFPGALLAVCSAVLVV